MLVREVHHRRKEENPDAGPQCGPLCDSVFYEAEKCIFFEIICLPLHMKKVIKKKRA